MKILYHQGKAKELDIQSGKLYNVQTSMVQTHIKEICLADTVAIRVY